MYSYSMEATALWAGYVKKEQSVSRSSSRTSIPGYSRSTSHTIVLLIGRVALTSFDVIELADI